MIVFLFTRTTYWQIAAAMALNGFGVGCVYAVNPLQITGGVPAAETGSAVSFYQLVRTVAYSVASALSATVLVLYIPRNRVFPSDAGYSGAAAVSIAVLVAALIASAVFAVQAGKRHPAEARRQPSRRWGAGATASESHDRRPT